MPLSFWNARELRACAEMLPSGPHWNFRVVPTTHTTVTPVHLYFCDSLDCIKSLFNHPLFASKMDFTPFRLFTTAEHIVQIYTKWMSSDGAWEMQVMNSSSHCWQVTGLIIMPIDKTTCRSYTLWSDSFV